MNSGSSAHRTHIKYPSRIIHYRDDAPFHIHMDVNRDTSAQTAATGITMSTTDSCSQYAVKKSLGTKHRYGVHVVKLNPPPTAVADTLRTAVTNHSTSRDRTRICRPAT